MPKAGDAIGYARTLLVEREQELAEELDRIRAAISAIDDVLGEADSDMDRELRGRSYTEAAELVLREAGRPLHVREIIERLRKRGYRATEPMKKMRSSLIGSLARKVREGDTFDSDKQGTYSLLVWQREGHDRSQIALAVDKPKPVDAIIELVRDQPGRLSTEVADELEDRVQSESPDPRKVVLTMIGQLVQQERLHRDPEGRLYLATKEVADGNP